jgi:anti-sigma factor RsiW
MAAVPAAAGSDTCVRGNAQLGVLSRARAVLADRWCMVGAACMHLPHSPGHLQLRAGPSDIGRRPSLTRRTRPLAARSSVMVRSLSQHSLHTSLASPACTGQLEQPHAPCHTLLRPRIHNFAKPS